jgi:hypothetical protein
MARPESPRLLLLLPTTTYRATAFVDTARGLGVDLTVASEFPSTFEREQPSGLLTLAFADPPRAAEQAAAFAREHPLTGVVGVDDDTAVVAAAVAERLRRAIRCRPRSRQDKHQQRERLAAARVPVPRFAVPATPIPKRSRARSGTPAC